MSPPDPDLPPLLEFTSAALAAGDPRAQVALAAAACAEHGLRFGIQLHNTASAETVALVAGLGVPVSVHAPLLGEHFANLAAADPAPAWASLATTAATMRRLGATLAVMHGFVMCDAPIPAFGPGRPYEACFAPAWRPELSLPGSSICADFTAGDEYALRFARVRERLAELRAAHPDLTFAVENDFPGYGAGLFLAARIVALGHPMCLDTGHLWAAAHLFGPPFHDQAGTMLRTGRVRLVHLHASPWPPETPPERWADGHRPLDTPNAMDLPRLVAACRRAGVRHFTLETAGASAADVRRFAAMWAAGAA